MDVPASLESIGHLLQGTSCCRDNGFCSTDLTAPDKLMLWSRPAPMVTKPGGLQSSLGLSGCREGLEAVETSGEEEEKPVRFLTWWWYDCPYNQDLAQGESLLVVMLFSVPGTHSMDHWMSVTCSCKDAPVPVLQHWEWLFLHAHQCAWCCL